MRLPPMKRASRLAAHLAFIASLFCLSMDAASAGSIGPTPAMPSLPESARAESVVEEDGPQLEARLLVSSRTPTKVGVLFDLAEGWHLYWRNPGETGIAPKLGLDVPGHDVGEIGWPTPQTFREADGLFTTYGYEGRVLLSAPIEAKNASDSDTLVHAETQVLVCRTQCVPASFSLSTPIDVALSEADRSLVDELFREAEAATPAHAAQFEIDASAHWAGDSPAGDETGLVELVVHSCGGDATACRPNESDAHASVFLPLEGETFEFGDARIATIDGEGGRNDDLGFTIAIQVTRLESGDDRLRGLIGIRSIGAETRYVEIDLPIDVNAGEAAIPPAMASIPIERWVQIFLLAMLGGLILNGMPCVLPVLAIKVVSVADMADKHPGEVRMHGLAYTAGVLGSMALLALVVLGMRSAGHSVGWGFQFQEPLFVAGICALLVAFALNLFGVFEIELGQGRLADVGHDATGFQRSAFEGLLAVVLATPCTAPFLGTAVGFAFATSGLGILGIFLAIGFGLASPFLLVSFEPRLARFIPRSGPWMIKLRGALGFSLLATVVWLLWVLGRTGGADAVIAMTGNLLFLAFLLWGFGQLQPTRNVWVARGSAATILVLAVAGLNLIEFDRGDAAKDAAITTDIDSEWQAYSEAGVREALASGQPAFVVFTADWCITCQVNEETVLERENVRQAFKDNDFALFKADWTRRDEGIRRKLAEFGRAGVPLYLVYTPGSPDRPLVLSELLRQSEVLASLEVARLAQRD